MAVEMEEGLPLAILPVDERDPKALRRALAPCCGGWGWRCR